MLKAIEDDPETLRFVPDHLKTQEMCEKVVEEEPYTLRLVPDYFKMKKMCERVVNKYPCALQCVPDWFVTQEWIDLWVDDNHNDNFLGGMMVIKNERIKKPQ